MRKWLFALAAVWGVLGLSSPARATALATGGTVLLPDLTTEEGTVQVTTASTFSFPSSGGAVSHGEYRESVYKQAGGTMDFVYQVSVDATSSGIVEKLTGQSYAGFTTDVTWTATVPTNNSGFVLGEVPPENAKRPSDDVIAFNFDPVLRMFPPFLQRVSFILIVRTNAKNWTDGAIGIIDGGGQSVFGYAPTDSTEPGPPSTPEPASLLLCAGLTMGWAGIALRRRLKGQRVVGLEQA